MDEKLMLKWQLFATPVQPTDANTFDYTAADLSTPANFGRLLLPGLRKIFFETYDEVPEQYAKVYKVDTSTQAMENDWGMGAFGDWTVRADQFAPVDYVTMNPGLLRTYTHSAFTQGFMVTREMYDDELYRQFEKLPMAMARSGRAKVEKDSAAFLINGFAVAIYDGQFLFSNTHPLLDGGATVGDNLAGGVLNDANLKAALKLMRETPDEAGNPAQFRGTKLIIPPALEDQAIRLVGSDKLTGTANNDTNKFLREYGIEIVVMDYLSAAAGGSDTAWYLQDGNRHEMNFFWRIRPEFKWDEDFDTFVAKYRGYMRFSLGVSDWRGIIGSTGQ